MIKRALFIVVAAFIFEVLAILGVLWFAGVINP